MIVKIKKLKLSLLMLFWISFSLHGQNTLNEAVNKNILTYGIRNSPVFNAFINSDNQFVREATTTSIFMGVVPPSDYTLELKYDTLGIYPPDSAYVLIGIKKNGLRFTDGWTTIKSSYDYFNFDDNFLVAFDPSQGVIKFISGAFYTSKISKDFDFEDNDEILRYVWMKLYHLGMENISLVKRRNNKLVLEGYSVYAKNTYKIKLYRKNMGELLLTPL